MLDEFASATLNGRQIKNVIRTAHALAMSAGGSLNKTQIDMSLNAMNLFEKDVSEDVEQTVDHSGERGPRKRKGFAEETTDDAGRSGGGHARKRLRANDEAGS